MAGQVCNHWFGHLLEHLFMSGKLRRLQNVRGVDLWGLVLHVPADGTAQCMMVRIATIAAASHPKKKQTVRRPGMAEICAGKWRRRA
mmetsp:Transcript_49629/g.107499  ORF Transcript_49629/g.107499 Transcript_49629/m.107499 type:complete len:87 (+) Transcript_49629:357-617(+)